MSGCTGHCCMGFSLGVEQIELLTCPDNERERVAQDHDKIFGMLIWLRWTYDDDGKWTGGKFTCKHFDVETRRCTDYENRPRMCSNYPYGSRCTFEDCTMPVEEQLTTGVRETEEVAA